MHDLVDAVESLTYWRERAQRLPWYRVGARREARELARHWEARVTRTDLWERRVQMRTRVSAGVDVWGTRLGRARVRRWLVGLAVLGATIVAVPLVLTVLVLSQ